MLVSIFTKVNSFQLPGNTSPDLKLIAYVHAGNIAEGIASRIFNKKDANIPHFDILRFSVLLVKISDVRYTLIFCHKTPTIIINRLIMVGLRYCQPFSKQLSTNRGGGL